MFRLLFLLAFFWFPSAHAGNRLAGSPVPYLALHGQDPTDWRVWDQSVFDDARRSGKLIMVSLGYFACHWCHVMQRETWADPAAADLINRNFIPVKVDRETHAALDARLQEFAERTRGRAGWPLTVFLTPEGYPLFAMLYGPRDEFMKVAEGLARRWREDRAGLTALARDAARPPASPVAQDLPGAFLQAARTEADELNGGFGAAAKFPMAPQLHALLAFQRHAPEPARRDFLKTTLDQMRAGALRDHVNGGFFRYAVDPGWEEPHFEKMLYDNVQLAMLYQDAAAVLREPAYLAVARETLDFLMAGMRAGPAFVASLSAVDAKGVEGGAYLWQADELQHILPPETFAVVARVWGLDLPSPFAGFLPYERRAPQPGERACPGQGDGTPQGGSGRTRHPQGRKDTVRLEWSGIVRVLAGGRPGPALSKGGGRSVRVCGAAADDPARPDQGMCAGARPGTR